MPARTVMVPRSNGPAWPAVGTWMASPNGASLYGPVRYTLPLTGNGAAPGPDSTWVSPILLASEHAPALAAPASHCGTEPMSASIPFGKPIWTPEKYPIPSGRVSENVNGENWPAAPLVMPAVNDGENAL